MPVTRIENFLLQDGGGTDKESHRRPKRGEVRRKKTGTERWVNTMAGSPGRSVGIGPSGWMGSGLPQCRADTGTQRGLSTRIPWKRNHRLPDVRDSGIGTGGTNGPGLIGESGVLKARWVVGSCGVDASTPMSGGMDWTCGRRVSRYSPIMDSQPLQSPTPEPGTGWGAGYAPVQPVH